MLPFGMFVYGEPRTAHTVYPTCPESRRELRGDPRSAAHPLLILCGSLRAFSGEFVVASLPCEVHPVPTGKADVTYLESTLMKPRASVATKELTGSLSPLDSTLTKNMGGGGVLWLTRYPNFFRGTWVTDHRSRQSQGV